VVQGGRRAWVKPKHPHSAKRRKIIIKKKYQKKKELNVDISFLVFLLARQPFQVINHWYKNRPSRKSHVDRSVFHQVFHLDTFTPEGGQLSPILKKTAPRTQQTDSPLPSRRTSRERDGPTSSTLPRWLLPSSGRVLSSHRLSP